MYIMLNGYFSFSYYAKLKRLEEERQKELESKYRDRVSTCTPKYRDRVSTYTPKYRDRVSTCTSKTLNLVDLGKR